MQGTRIGPFLVHEKLGPYKRHQVYHATQTEQQRDVALKFINLPAGTSMSKAISRIQRENKILKQLNHPNLVKVHGAGVEGNQIFFALELVEGEPLSSILSRRSKLAWELACDYARQIACCLEYLHSQELLHLKLTPDKILITSDGHVKVSDLRLNRSKKRRWDAVKLKSMDTAAYIAPEQFAGEQGTTRSDFYALGVILFEMLTGKLPYTADSLASLAKIKSAKEAPLVSQYTLECPMWMDKIVSSLLAIRPEDRPYSARSIIVALDEIRRADREGTSVAEKLVSGFSPLTVGKDKTEARKALGIKKPKRQEDDTPLLQRTGFLAGSFIAVIALMLALVVYINWPLTPEQLMDRARQQARNGEIYTAQQTLLEILKRDENPLTEDAEFLLVELRTEKLLERAEKHPIAFKYATTGPVSEFFKGYDFEQVERYDEALMTYDNLLTTVSYENLDERHIVNATLARKIEIEKKRKQLAEEDQRQKSTSPADPDLPDTSESSESTEDPDSNSEPPTTNQKSKAPRKSGDIPS